MNNGRGRKRGEREREIAQLVNIQLLLLFSDMAGTPFHPSPKIGLMCLNKAWVKEFKVKFNYLITCIWLYKDS